jgi:membrane protease YdiL (CAAX protease family)
MLIRAERATVLFANPSLARRLGGFMAAFIACCAIAPHLGDGHFNYVALHGVGVGFAVVGWVACRPSQATMGLTLTGARASLLRGVGVSAGLGLLSIAARLGCDALGRTPPGTPLFRATLPPFMIAYVLFSVPFQEIAFRGVMQGIAREAVGDARHARAFAVAASTLCFGCLHLSWGISFAIVSLVPGLLFAIQVERDRTLLGAILAHALSGWFFFSCLSMTAVLYAS